MSSSDAIKEQLTLKVKSGMKLIQIVSYEWRRIHGFVVLTCKDTNRELYRWNNVEGIGKWDFLDKVFTPYKDNFTDPIEALEWYRKTYEETNNSILILEDFHLYLDQNSMPHQYRQIIENLRIFARQDLDMTIVISQPIHRLPLELEKDVFVLEIPLPKTNTLIRNIEEVIKELGLDEISAPEEDYEILAESALGLTEFEAKYAFKEIGIMHGKLTRHEIPYLVEYKEQIIRKSGILEYFHPSEDLSDVGGMKNLKKWLKDRKAGFESAAKDFGITPPKGVLLLGVQGCGKSLIAKAIASEWNLPLLKFDLGKVFGGIVGESESNIRKALTIAEAIAPSILWIDEIEKGLSGVASSNYTDGGTTARVFGTLLTWMQEKKEPVFVIATANNIEQLPPELLRKGRFDEIFFVDLPSKKEREEIWNIHLKKRLKGRFDTVKIDLNILTDKSKGYSGAEIEEAINEALYTAYNEDRELTTKDLIEALKQTFPLSKIMAKKISKLREWAKYRARLASSEKIEPIPEDEQKVPLLRTEVSNIFVD